MMAPAAINAAVNDALAPLGVRLTELPMTPDRILARPLLRERATGEPADERRGGRRAVSPGPTAGSVAAIAVALAADGFAIAATARDPATPAGHGREVEAGRRAAGPAGLRRAGRGVGRSDGGARRRRSGPCTPSSPTRAWPARLRRCTRSASSEWRDCLATDLDGVFLTFRAFVPALIAAAGGSLIAISSMTGKRPLHGRTPYAAAKMGVIGLVRTLAAGTGSVRDPGQHGLPRRRRPGRASKTSSASRPPPGDQRGRGPGRVHRGLPAGPAGGRPRKSDEPAPTSPAAAAAITGEDLNVTAGVVMY